MIRHALEFANLAIVERADEILDPLVFRPNERLQYWVLQLIQSLVRHSPNRY